MITAHQPNPDVHTQPSNQSSAATQQPTSAPTYSLHDMRKRSGITGVVVAEMCNTTYQSIRNWEKGEKIPSIINVMELLKIYGYTVEQLDLTPFYKGLNERANDKKKQETNRALTRLDEMRRQHAPDAT